MDVSQFMLCHPSRGPEEEAVLQAEVSIINVLKDCGGMFLVGVFICFITCSTQWKNQEF